VLGFFYPEAVYYKTYYYIGGFIFILVIIFWQNFRYLFGIDSPLKITPEALIFGEGKKLPWNLVDSAIHYEKHNILNLKFKPEGKNKVQFTNRIAKFFQKKNILKNSVIESFPIYLNQMGNSEPFRRELLKHIEIKRENSAPKEIWFSVFE